MGIDSMALFVPINQSSLPEQCESWLDVADLLSEYYENQKATGLRMTSSRNWTHQDALHQLCQGLEIKDLQFVWSEVISLGAIDLQSAASSLDSLLALLKEGFPEIGLNEKEYGALWWLRREMVSGEIVRIPKENIQKAFTDAKAEYRVHPKGDSGYEAVLGFFAFLKSLRDAISEAIHEEKHLLYVLPQP